MNARPLLAAAALAVLLPVPGAAAGTAPQGTGGASKKVLVQDELSVEGKVERPAVKPITPPPGAVPSGRPRRESFLPKIVAAVDKEPF